MIRSTKISLKFANTSKLKSVHQFIDDYKKLVIQFVDLTWEVEGLKPLLPKEITSQVSTTLSARIIQCAGKQASGIVRGTKEKQKKRLKQIEKFNNTGQFKKARKLQAIYDKVKVSKPDIQNVEPELDSRFVKIDLEKSNTSFDGWVTLTSIGNKLKLVLPFKRTKPFNKLFKKGTLKQGIRISKKGFTFMFDIEKPLKTEGSVLGIDIGKTTAISCSNGWYSKPDNHNHDLTTILNKMSRKKTDSKAFERCQEQRKNYINWSINQLNLDKTKRVNIENIKGLRFGKNVSKKLRHWTYTEIFDKIERQCEDNGVQVFKISPTYTSQRCSNCGWTCRSNRKGKQFKCGHCGFTMDADLNASLNIALPLPAISKQQRLKKASKEGFYWLPEGQAPIVPVVNKTNNNEIHIFH
jgi:IS605 OrfB family transposase